MVGLVTQSLSQQVLALAPLLRQPLQVKQVPLAPAHPDLQTRTCTIQRIGNESVPKIITNNAITSGKSGPKDQVALHYYYTSPSHCCTTHEVPKL